ncbi:MAG: nucleotidyltransferase domain-containing protein [Chitinophagales bacterium]|nr:nucleotidyltransferase domain-containing protein [Chitinophagales bacterium]
MQLTTEQIQIIREYLSNKPVLKAYVFGSYARGDADENSDIDLLINLDRSKKIGLQYVAMQLELEDLLKHKVDFAEEELLKPFVRKFVDRDKKLVYEKAVS